MTRTKIRVTRAFHYFPVCKAHYDITVFEHVELVRNDDHRHRAFKMTDSLGYLLLCITVERTRRFIENKHFWLPIERARDR